ncbi:MAG: helix-turn-helix transcriptional regulator [Clostridia bacterium]|nr:helix-turn-helix transcriptional regulator [Clostridia bacterium]
MKNIGKRIKTEREKKKFTVEKLAKKMKVEPQVILDWESGESEPDNKSVKRLSDIFFVPTDYLLFGVAQGSGVHTMFPSNAKPQKASAASLLAFTSAMILFVGIGGIIIMFVLTGARLVTAGDFTFWEYFMLSGAVDSAVGFLIVTVVGAVIGLVSIGLMKKKGGKKK